MQSMPLQPSIHGRAYPGHPRLWILAVEKAWMPGTRPGMTRARTEGVDGRQPREGAVATRGTG
jgi:hypothetical protein